METLPSSRNFAMWMWNLMLKWKRMWKVKLPASWITKYKMNYWSDFLLRKVFTKILVWYVIFKCHHTVLIPFASKYIKKNLVLLVSASQNKWKKRTDWMMRMIGGWLWQALDTMNSYILHIRINNVFTMYGLLFFNWETHSTRARGSVTGCSCLFTSIVCTSLLQIFCYLRGIFTSNSFLAWEEEHLLQPLTKGQLQFRVKYLRMYLDRPL